MAELYNVYCDESCHLEHDGIPVMVLGAVWCKQTFARRASLRIRSIKTKHGLPSTFEVKWSRVTNVRFDLYRELVDYFFSEDELHFRGLLVSDKDSLDHAAYRQSHNEYYYKMCFRLLEPIIQPAQIYRIYLDIKDTNSEKHRAKLERRLQGRRFSQEDEFLHRVQHIHSRESEVMQLCDLLTGAIGYCNRHLEGGGAKVQLVAYIRERSKWNLDGSTPRRESKFNLLKWQAKEVGP
jgi:Protein of unknown function (DUF3800)